MTTILIGICAGLGALVLLLFGLLVARLRRSSSAEEKVAEVVAGLTTRMDELGQELQGALERAEEEGRWQEFAKKYPPLLPGLPTGS